MLGQTTRNRSHQSVMTQSARILLAVAFIAFCGISVSGTVRYVSANNATPTAPYTNWATAAVVIQDAIDVALVGDLILVTNGVYQTGGIAVFSSQTNRVALTKAVTVQSVNGAEVTVIRGYQIPGMTNGEAAVRCAYLTNGASLIGFTLTNGATFGFGYYFDYQSGGGAFLSMNGVLSNCTLVGNTAYSDGGGAFGGVLNDCILIGNRAYVDGGGAVFSTLSNCFVFNNRADLNGGGVNYGTLNNCTVISNTALYNGGGTADSTLRNCTLMGNAAMRGGGASGGTLTTCNVVSNSAGSSGGAGGSIVSNCVLAWNSAESGGGGVGFCDVKNSVIVGNSAKWGGGAYQWSLDNSLVISNRAEQGGGAFDSMMRNCTILFNDADQGGGMYLGSVYNSIVYNNVATNADNYYQGPGGVANRNCLKPLPPVGAGNFTNAPLLLDQAAGDFRLQSISPCINAGRNADAPEGLDLSANPRIVGATVDLGAHEFQTPGSLISYAWLQQYGLPTDGSIDHLDTDGDGHNCWQEWRAGTVPSNNQSVLRMFPPTRGVSGLTVKWESIAGKHYWIERATNRTAIFPFLTRATNIVALSNSTAFNDITATNVGPYYYRIGVRE